MLKIETDPTLVDVNIHPTKQDIKFSKLDDLNKLIRESVASALRKVLLVPKVEVDVRVPEPIYSEISMPLVMEDEEPYTTLEQVSIDFKESEVGTFADVLEIQEKQDLDNTLENELVKKLELYPVGIALGTYIIAQNQDGVFLIDQHAAQERINYEKNLEALRSEKVTTTSVLIPISIELSASEFLKIKDSMDLLNELGFVIEEFGVNSYIVKEHPTWLRVGLETESVKKIFDIIIEGKYLFDRVKFNEHIAITMACKMSVKGNEAITLEQAENLLNDLVLCDNPYNCPHGRPTIISFTTYELERMFKRVMN